MDMEQWARVRRKVLVDGESKRSVMSAEGLHWETLQKMLSHSQPPGYRLVKPRGRKIEPHVEWVRRVLESDVEVPRKQRHSATRIFDRLKAEQGYEGGYTAVRELVVELKAIKQEVFVPLSHRPGEAQVDFGHALVNIKGVLKKCPFFVMSLPYTRTAFHPAFTEVSRLQRVCKALRRCADLVSEPLRFEQVCGFTLSQIRPRAAFSLPHSEATFVTGA